MATQKERGAAAAAAAAAAPGSSEAQSATMEVVARRDVWRGGKRVPEGAKVSLPRAEYERDPSLWETESDRRASADKRAAAAKPPRDEAFWQRVEELGQVRERGELAMARAADEVAERNRALAQQAREAAEKR